MGLFNRKNPYEKDVLDLEAAIQNASLQPEPRVRQPAQAPLLTAPPIPAGLQAPAAQPLKTSYGIEDAVKLVRELPDNKKEMVIAIVQKTLLSAKISISSIIEDATRKIERLEKKNDKLGQEIRELEEAIQKRKIEMNSNERDVVETRDVKSSFESAYQKSAEDMQQRSASQPPAIGPTSPYIPGQKAG